MATKNDLITRLAELSDALGRELDTSGSVADLELRVREAEEELGEPPIVEGPVTSKKDDDSKENSTAINSGITSDIADDLVRVKALKTITLTVKSLAGSWRPEIVAAGRVVDLQRKNFESLPRGLVTRSE